MPYNKGNTPEDNSPGSEAIDRGINAGVVAVPPRDSAPEVPSE